LHSQVVSADAALAVTVGTINAAAPTTANNHVRHLIVVSKAVRGPWCISLLAGFPRSPDVLMGSLKPLC
jgi:hypothetical protein